MSAGGSTRARRTARAAALARDAHRCQQPTSDAQPCGRPATTVLAVVARVDGGDLADAANLRAACDSCARRTYQLAAQRENARRAERPPVERPAPPLTAASSPATIRRAVLARAGHRCEQHDDGRRCTAEAWAAVRDPDQLDVPTNPPTNRRALCREHAHRSYARTARAGAARAGWTPPPVVDQLTGAAARIAADLDSVGAPADASADTARRLLRAAGLPAGGSTPRQVAVSWRRAHADRPPPVPQLLLLDATATAARAAAQLAVAASQLHADAAARLLADVADNAARLVELVATASTACTAPNPPCAHDRSARAP